ncbi:MAG TPA: hypothetical protein DDZ76_11665 [Xanthomonadales bacterium]|nr:hypothetical protein [Xanthomonadales bacterium]
MPDRVPDRAVIFIDGNNWYHSIKSLGLESVGRLDYGKLSQKLIGPREWKATRYYIGQVPQAGDTSLYTAQRRFLASLQATDNRISTHLGRIEERPVKNQAASELLTHMANLQIRIDQSVCHDLIAIGRCHQSVRSLVEKAVDVMLAVDMVVMAERDEYDAAYLLSADGDFTPAVRAVRGRGKKVYAVSPAVGAQLAAAANSFIRLKEEWFEDCST